MHFSFKLFISTFVLIFLAELGDKTQLAAMAKSIEGRFTVFIAASLALVCSTLIAVLFGEALTRIIPERVLQIASALLFLFFGSLMLYNVVREGKAPETAAAECEEHGFFERLIAGTAVAFEEAAERDYLRLAEQTDDGSLRDLLKALAAEEREHSRQLKELCRTHGEEAVYTGEALPSLDELIHDVSDDAGASLVDHAVEHEQATARFYEQLAESAPVPGVRKTLKTLAAEEYAHAETLKSLKKA